MTKQIMICIPPVSLPASLSCTCVCAVHQARFEKRGDLAAVHAKVTERAKGREKSSEFSLCGFYQTDFCLVPCHAPDSSKDCAHSHNKLVYAITNTRGKVKLLIECKGFLIWLTAYFRAALYLLGGHKQE